MSRKGSKVIIQESMKDYGEEAAEGTKATSQGGDKFDVGDNKFEEARSEENVFDGRVYDGNRERDRGGGRIIKCGR